jgi:dCTP deaminase
MSESKRGVLPSQDLNRAIEDEWVSSGDYRIRPEAVQPASIDLRLGDFAWALRCSFLPDVDSTVEEKIDGLAFQRVDLRDGAVLERDRPYLVPLIEELNLPEDMRAKANPKSSTGRLDVFTRVITDRHHRFDDIRAGYQGKLYLEIVPRSFAIQVKAGLSLNQLRLARGDVRLPDDEIRGLQDEFPLLYLDSHALRQSELAVSDGLFLSLDLSGPTDRVVGYRAKKNSLPVDLSRIRAYRWTDYWDPVYPEPGGRVVLEPEIFYLLLSAEGVCIPPQIAAEMMAYDPTAGELRTHYAGFFDPGFGYDPEGGRHGSRAALEVRARDVSFMVEHRQPVCKLGLEWMSSPAERLYGAGLGSNYQGQVTMLSKHFEEQTAGAPVSAEANRATIERLYEAFGQRNGAAMTACYAPDAHFRDPAFGDLEGDEVGAMWRMLAGRVADLEIELREHEAGEETGSAHWIARYTFSATGRPVVNDVRARFRFSPDGRIADHVDEFDFRTWAKQALGPSGHLVALLPPLRSKARAKALDQLAAFRLEETGSSL